MNKKTFISELDYELTGHPYHDRFLAEMENHIEDLENDNKPLKQMGNPKNIKKHFLSVLHPWRTLFFLTEGIFFGLILLPLSLISFIFGGYLYDLVDPNSTLGSEGLIYLLVIMPMIMALWFIAFGVAWKRWQKLYPTTGYPIWLWAVLVLIPSLINLLSIFNKFLSFADEPMSIYEKFSYFAVAGINAVIIFGTAYYAWRVVKKQKLEKMKVNQNNGIKRAIPFTVFLYIGSYALMRTIGSYATGYPYSGIPELAFLTTFYFPIAMVEFAALIFWTLLLSSPDGDNQLIFGMYLIGFIILFLGLQSIISMLQNKHWSWIRGGIVLYTFSLFFMNGTAFSPNIDFQVPSHFVSEALEQHQMKWFFGLTRYASSDEGHLFRYVVDFNEEDESFTLQQNSGKEFHFLASEWKDVAEWSQKSKPITLLSANGGTWPEELKCDGVPQASRELIYCNELTFNNIVIFDEDYQKEVTDVAISTDKKWLLLVMRKGAYDPEHVYLLEL